MAENDSAIVQYKQLKRYDAWIKKYINAAKSSLIAEDITDETIDLDSLILTEKPGKKTEYVCLTESGSANISSRPTYLASDGSQESRYTAFRLIVENVRWESDTKYMTVQTFVDQWNNTFIRYIDRDGSVGNAWTSWMDSTQTGSAEEIQVSSEQPIDPKIKLWLSMSDDSISIPQIDDENISEVDTWSSAKINREVPNIKVNNASNADKLGNLDPSNFIMHSSFYDINDDRILIPNDVNVGEWLRNNAKTGILYYINPDSTGLTGLPIGVNTAWIWFIYNGITIIAKSIDQKMFYADDLNGFNGWKPFFDNSLVSNPNLLINPDFKINQRGLTEYGGAQYTVDRWFNDVYTTVTVDSDGITVTAVTDIAQEWWAIYQKIENISSYMGLPMTISVYVTEFTGEWFIPTDTNSSELPGGTRRIPITKTGLNTIYTSTLNVINQFGIGIANVKTGDYIKLKWMKVEVGLNATQFVPPDPATELMKCYRYFQKLDPGFPLIGTVSDSTTFRMAASTLSPMRITPRIQLYQHTGDFTWSFGWKNGDGSKSFYTTNFSDLSAKFIRMDGSTMNFLILVPSQPLTPGTSVSTFGSGGIYYTLDAEI